MRRAISFRLAKMLYVYSFRVFVLIASTRGCVKGCETLSAARAEAVARGSAFNLFK